MTEISIPQYYQSHCNRKINKKMLSNHYIENISLSNFCIYLLLFIYYIIINNNWFPRRHVKAFCLTYFTYT